MTWSPEQLPPLPTHPPQLDEDFSRGLRPEWWVPHYLPQWTTPDRSEARYRIVPAGIELLIEDDQPDWRPEDAPLRVSNLQTGTFSGEVGSDRGTHRHRDGLRVRTETALQLLFAPTHGRVDLTVTASGDEGCMLAAWLIGTEHLSAEDSGEICIFEIDADAIGTTTATVRTGVKAHHDPRLTTDMAEVTIPLDASRPQTWTAIWDDTGVIIGCDGRVLRRLADAPSYPLFLMVDLFEIGPASGRYPKSATVHRVRGWDETTAPRLGTD